jgi:acyl carrier protein
MLSDLKQRIYKVIADRGNLHLEDIKNECTFSELGFDSLDNLELIMAFESEFSIKIPDADMEKILTVQDAIDYISKK